MAEDIWTLNLVCEGAARGQENVQREMDRDEICFFNLVALIEEYGYTSIDYLYYKKKDNLVALQLDTDVMKMLEENESKKNVSLFVTRQRIATIAPTKSNKEPSKSAANKAKGNMQSQFALFCICFSIQENLIYYRNSSYINNSSKRSYTSSVHRHYMTLNMFLLFQHLFIEKSGRKKKQQLNIIQSKEQYANEADHQLADDDIQETPGTYLFGILIKYRCNWEY